MKKLLTLFLLSALLSNYCRAQSKIKNIIIVTTDGFRWQEVFRGVDRQLALATKDTAAIFKKFGAQTAEGSRAKLMPFFWGTMAKQGQIYGNRDAGNMMNVANQYWFSYPGYNEIFTGYPDVKVNSNNYQNNPNTTVLDYLSNKPAYKGKVAVYAAWDAFDRIFNKPRVNFPVIAAFEKTGGSNPSVKEQLINKMLADSYKPFGYDECLDVFTHYAATEYIQTHKPRVLYISYGETDEWAHANKYLSYLEAAHQVDKWLNDIWTSIQKDPFYKDNTALLITADHGRGEGKDWTDHGADVKGANQIWFAVMAPGLSAKGEIKQPMQNYQQQLAQTIANLLGEKFTAEHPIADALVLK